MKERTGKRIVDGLFCCIFIFQTLGVFVGIFNGNDFDSMENFISAIQFIVLIYIALGSVWLFFRFMLVKLFR